MMMNCRDRNGQQFSSNYQKILLVKELQKCFGKKYLSEKKKILSDDLFIVTNKSIDHNMDMTQSMYTRYELRVNTFVME